MIYWGIMFFLSMASLMSQYKSAVSKLTFYMFMFFLFLFVAFRYQISLDWWNYLVIFSNHLYLDFDQVMARDEPLFGLINWAGGRLGFTDTLFTYTVCAIIVFFFLTKFLLRSRAYWYGLLIYFPVHILVVSMGYVRQSVAIAILLYAFLMLLDKKNLQFLFWVFVAFLFHRSAIIMLFFFPLQYLNVSKVMAYLYQAASILVITGILFLSVQSENSVYTSGEMTSTGTYLRLVLHVVPLYYYLKYRDSFFKVNYPDFYKVLDFYFVLICTCFLLSIGFSTLADRFNLYMIFFDLFVLLTLYFHLSKNRRNNMVLLTILLNVLAFSLWKIFGFGAHKSYEYQNYIINYLGNSLF